MRWRFTLLLALGAAAALPGAEPPQSPELPFGAVGLSGYREFSYRAPTPATSPVAWTVSAAEAKVLLATQQAIAIDVMGATLRPAQGDLPAAWLVSEPHATLPGSVWLPNVGLPDLTPSQADYFRRELARITDGDSARGLLFFCVADCWLSWNAALRASRLGYRNLYWLPTGSDGWRAAGWPLEEAQPVPLTATYPTTPPPKEGER